MAGVDVSVLIDVLDNQFSDDGMGANASDYQRVFVQQRDARLCDSGAALYKTVEQIEDFTLVEDAIRQAGFIQGFQVCRQLLAGDLNLSALKAGAR